jgi:hypothetical protein
MRGQRRRFDPRRVEPGLREAFSDRFGRKAAAVALDACHAFLGDGRDQPIIVIERGPGVVGVIDPQYDHLETRPDVKRGSRRRRAAPPSQSFAPHPP